MGAEGRRQEGSHVGGLRRGLASPEKERITAPRAAVPPRLAGCPTDLGSPAFVVSPAHSLASAVDERMLFLRSRAAEAALVRSLNLRRYSSSGGHILRLCRAKRAIFASTVAGASSHGNLPM